MSTLIAALPMYDWPEIRAEVDAGWAEIGGRLRSAGIDAPATLIRRNADMPAVPGGIRGADGSMSAPDPASLPVDHLDLQTLWRHPRLLFSQTCWGPMELGLSAHVRVVGQPDYSAFEGGAGELYSSAILMRRDEAGVDAEQSPPDGRALLPTQKMRGRRLAFNADDSMSGVIALGRDLDAAGESLQLFDERIETGGHRLSIVAVADGRADICAIDCRSWDLAKRFEPAAGDLVVVGWTARRKGLPFVTARATDDATFRTLRAVAASLMGNR